MYQAQGIVQEAAARGWRHTDNFRSSEEARTWLSRVVRDLAHHHYRARRVRPPEPLTGEHPEAPAEDRTEELPTSRSLVEALRDLPPPSTRRPLSSSAAPGSAGSTPRGTPVSPRARPSPAVTTPSGH
ncbi:sigma factor [Streptomyces sp. NPDC002308]